MRHVCWLPFMLVLLSTDVVRADQPPRRTTRVASGPVRSAPRVEPSTTTATLIPSPTIPPPFTRPELVRPALLEPSCQIEGVGHGMVARFQVEADPATEWQLVVRETDGPIAQVFEGRGTPPAGIPWDGRLVDGELAWSGVVYTYVVAFVDSSGVAVEVAGTEFTLPAYSREDQHGISFLMPGRKFVSGRRGDPLTAAVASLESAAEQLNREDVSAAVRVEVLARDETVAVALGENVRNALGELLDSADRAVELYVGTAAAAPPEGTVLITTAPLS